MPTPRKNPRIVQEWTKILSDYISHGKPKSHAYFFIADTYDVSYTTVRHHLDHFQCEKRRRYARELYRKRSREKVLTRKYNRNYRRLTRHPERFLSPVFNSKQTASTEEIQNNITELAEGVKFRSPTIERILNRYICQKRGPPFLEVIEEGVYRIHEQESEPYK